MDISGFEKTAFDSSIAEIKRIMHNLECELEIFICDNEENPTWEDVEKLVNIRKELLKMQDILHTCAVENAHIA